MSSVSSKGNINKNLETENERLKKIICEQTIAIDALKNVINRQKRLGMVHTLLDNNNNNKRMSIRKTLAYSGCIKNM